MHVALPFQLQRPAMTVVSTGQRDLILQGYGCFETESACPLLPATHPALQWWPPETVTRSVAARAAVVLAAGGGGRGPRSGEGKTPS